MPHCDPDVLALRALGEEVGSPEAEAHLATCGRCRAELEQLRSVVRTARSGGPDDAPEQPPARVWEGITAELGLAAQHTTAAVAGEPVTAEPVTGSPVTPDAASVGTTRAGTTPAGTTPAGTTPAGIDELAAARDRRSWRALRSGRTAGLLAAAAAAGVVAGGLGVWTLTGAGSEPAPEVVAKTSLDPLPSWDAEGAATVEVRADGSRVLVVDLAEAGAADHDGFHEVWLLAPDVSQLVSLGVLDGERGTFAIPAALDLAELPVVDVSLEPYDGDPAHSGDSVVRGTLDS